MVKRDDYNYQELRRSVGVVENDYKLLKMMCLSLNRDVHTLKNQIVLMNSKNQQKVSEEKKQEKEEKENKKVSFKGVQQQPQQLKTLEDQLSNLPAEQIEKLLNSLMKKNNNEIDIKTSSRKGRTKKQSNELDISLDANLKN